MGQLGSLVGLRWRMVRSRRTRQGLLLLASSLPFLLVCAVVIGQSLPRGQRLFDLLLLAPTVYLVFAVLALAAPLVAGGGNELFPEEQLVAYPIRPRTVFQSGLLVAPLNLAWTSQVVLLLGVTAAVAERGVLVVLAVLTCLAYVVLVTVAGQAVAWLVVGVRQRRTGRRATRALALLLAAASLAVMGSGAATGFLDRSPTTRVVIAAIQGSGGGYRRWLLVTGALVLLTWLAGRLGVRACAWALRRTTPVGRPELAPVVRRPARASVLAELVAVDVASVWRSTPLRRGLLVLAVLPGGVAMLADPTWASLALLPGLVAAGAGLLFGVNAFCLDGSGAVWVATMPHRPLLTLLAKVAVVAQTCLVAVLLALVLAGSQVGALPTGPETVALLGSVVGSTLLVVATCARTSVERPHKADLRGPRDTPAPPATMAVYSLRLALVTTWPGLLFVAAGATGSWEAGALGLVIVGALALRSLVGTFRTWQNEAERSRVVTTVAFG